MFQRGGLNMIQFERRWWWDVSISPQILKLVNQPWRYLFKLREYRGLNGC